MSAFYDDKHNAIQADSHKKAESDERIMQSKSDDWWVKKNFGEKIKMTGNLIFARTPEDFHKEIARQNKKIAEGQQ
jgi:hypothetical protein